MITQWSFAPICTSKKVVVNAAAVTFVYNGSIYCGLGDNTSKTIYRFDTTTYKWTPDITIPAAMSARIHPFCFQINNKVYIGGGYNTTLTNINLQDVWEFDPTQGSSASAWRKMTDFPDDPSGCFAFAIGTNGYVQTGYNTYYGKNMSYEFFLSSPTDVGNWVPLKALNVQNHPASGFTIGNTAYLGGGSMYDATQATAFYSYSPTPGAGLVPLANLPEGLNNSSTSNVPAFATGGKGYIPNYNSMNMFQYDPVGNSWSLFSALPKLTGFYFATAIGNRIFAWGYTGTTLEYIP